MNEHFWKVQTMRKSFYDHLRLVLLIEFRLVLKALFELSVRAFGGLSHSAILSIPRDSFLLKVKRLS
ncbi:MAG: hypothetical protein ACJAS3_002015 [Roseivirga sp.]|jgi:hypothetical protein